jgi:hypothetical protein
VAYESYRRLEEALAHLVDTGSSLKLNKALAFWNERNTRPCGTIEWDETAFVHLRLLQHGLGKDEEISIALKEACDEAGFVVLLRFVECEVHGETWKSDEAICKQANIDIGRKDVTVKITSTQRSGRSAFFSATVMSPESLDSTSAAPWRSADGVGDR